MRIWPHLLLLAAGACDRSAPTSPVPAVHAAEVARIEAKAPITAPARTGGFLMPAETGRQIRAQAVRRPPPGTQIHPPPPAS